jgi:AcrR family transcriptional regulator
MPRMSAVKRREDFIEAAVKVIAQHGVDGATTRRIAAEAGAPLASLHYCFSTKEQLFADIYVDLGKTVAESVWHVRKGAGLGRSAAGLLRQIMRWYQDNQAYAQAQLELLFWVARQNNELARQTYRIFSNVVAEKLRLGMRADDDENLIEPLTTFVLSAADGLLPAVVTFGFGASIEGAIDAMAESMERLTEAHRTVEAAVST